MAHLFKKSNNARCHPLAFSTIHRFKHISFRYFFFFVIFISKTNLIDTYEYAEVITIYLFNFKNTAQTYFFSNFGPDFIRSYFLSPINLAYDPLKSDMYIICTRNDFYK